MGAVARARLAPRAQSRARAGLSPASWLTSPRRPCSGGPTAPAGTARATYGSGLPPSRRYPRHGSRPKAAPGGRERALVAPRSLVVENLTMPPQVSSSTLEAVLERIAYANEETGYTVARVAVRRFSDLVTVVGPLLGALPGESLRLEGRWTSHPQYGRQFQVDRYTTVLPATIQGIGRYLGSGLIKGIGPKLADRIVDRFGIETLEVIEEQAERLVEVPGLGPKRTAMIAAA